MHRVGWLRFGHWESGQETRFGRARAAGMSTTAGVSHRTEPGSSTRPPPAFDPARYKERNTVERCLAKLKQFRAVAARYG
jgi:transposase